MTLIERVKLEARDQWPTIKHGQNAGAHCHVPVGMPSKCDTVRITEGELKADVAFARTGLPTVSVPGIGQWRSSLPVIEQLGARHVIIAYDSPEFTDTTKPTAKHAVALASELIDHGYDVEIETWQPEAGKGVDDVIAAGHETSTMTLDGLLSMRPDLAEDESASDRESDKEAPLVPVSIGELIDTHPELKPSVLDGLLRAGETCNIIAAPKVGKSWLVYLLILCVVTGRRWLDTFETVAGPVLLIDNELHPPTIAHRLQKVAGTLFIPRSEYEHAVDIVSLRGRLTAYEGLGGLVDRIERGHYQVIVVDAHYRMLPPDVTENDNAGMAQVYNLIDQYAGMTDAAWVLIHHASKGQQGDKAVTDVGAGAGSQSRAADTHLVIRQHEEADHAVLEAALRSFRPVDPLTIKWQFPLWVPTDLDPANLKRQVSGTAAAQDKRDREGKKTIVECLSESETRSATATQLRRAAGMGADRLNKLLRQLVKDGTVTKVSAIQDHNEAVMYQLHGG